MVGLRLGNRLRSSAHGPIRSFVGKLFWDIVLNSGETKQKLLNALLAEGVAWKYLLEKLPVLIP